MVLVGVEEKIETRGLFTKLLHIKNQPYRARRSNASSSVKDLFSSSSRVGTGNNEIQKVKAHMAIRRTQSEWFVNRHRGPPAMAFSRPSPSLVIVKVFNLRML